MSARRTEQEGSRQTSPKSTERSESVALRPPDYGIAFVDEPTVQRMAEGEGSESGAGVHRAARAGVVGNGHRLPHFDTVQRAFGSQPIGHIHAYVGPQATAAARAIGASAYTLGSKIVFASPNPSLHEVAHEAAHVVQQAAGVHLFGGVGEVGDRYEQHAEEVARATTEGRSAEPILNSFVGDHAAAGSPAVQRISADGKSQTESTKPVVAAGEGYIRAVAKADASSWTTDHAWVIIEYVQAADNAPITIVTDLRKDGVKWTRDGNAVPYASSLMNAQKYIGTTYKITEAQAVAAVQKGDAVSAGYQFDTVKGTNAEGVPTTTSVPRAGNSYIYNITGKATFGITNRINCARYAAKLLKAAGVGSGWGEIRPRGGWLFKTPGQVAGGLFGQTKN